MPTSERGASADATPAQGTGKRLACIPCQQRKLKCDHRIPCSRCLKGGIECVASSWNPRQRRRRYPERVLIDRLRRYEELLRDHAIAFEPLHPAAESSDLKQEDGAPDAAVPSEAVFTPTKSSESSSLPKAKTFWDVVKQTTQVEDNHQPSAPDIDEHLVRTAWDKMHPGEDLLLFGTTNLNMSLLGLHPTQVNIFKLWQIYLDNVDPVLKVTHAPSTQAQIIDATSDLSNVAPAFEALMFSIYAVALQSLSEEDCKATFGTTKESALPAYRFGCHQALGKAGAPREDDLDCLTAMFLYLISAESRTDPRTLSSALAIPLRVAQRMGLDTESRNSQCEPLEAELRRRLWWAMTAFDNRMGEQSQNKARSLDPCWDCAIPLNVHDSDLQSGMSELPREHERPTPSLFVVVYALLHDYLRYSDSHLEFTNPLLKPVAHQKQRKFNDLNALETYLETTWFSNCDQQLHLNTILTSRRTIAKFRLMEFSSRLINDLTPPSDAERDTSIASAVSMLESDTQLVSSPITKGFRWFASMHFPFPAYLHVIKDLRDRPLAEHVEKTWKVLSDNHIAHMWRVTDDAYKDNPIFKTLAGLILQAWALRVKAVSQTKEPLGATPDIVVRSQAITARTKNTAASDAPASSRAQTLEDPPPNDNDLFGDMMGWDSTAFEDLDFETGAGMFTTRLERSLIPFMIADNACSTTY